MDNLILHDRPNTASADLLVRDLVDELLELRTRLADVEDERETYRLLAQQALAELHRLTVTNRQLADRVRDQQQQIRDLLQFDPHEAAA